MMDDEYEDCDHDWKWDNCLNCNGYMGQTCTRCGAWSDGGDYLATNANWCTCEKPKRPLGLVVCWVCGNYMTQNTQGDWDCLTCEAVKEGMTMKMKLKLARWIQYHLAAGPDKEERNIPGTEARLEFGEPDDDGRPRHIATTDNNDGFELWLGYRWEWHGFYNDKDARRLAWFILWDWWAKTTWFGLKRRIWYWALHEIVKSYQFLNEKPGTNETKQGGL